MLFRHDILQGIAEGRVTLAFRRWRRAPPADGSSLRSPVGVLCLDRVTVVDEGDITTEDIRRTGMSPDELRASLAGEGTLLRIELRLAQGHPYQPEGEPWIGKKAITDNFFSKAGAEFQDWTFHIDAVVENYLTRSTEQEN